MSLSPTNITSSSGPAFESPLGFKPLSCPVCLLCSYFLQGAVELLTLLCTATEAGRPRISQDRTISPPQC